MKDEVASIEQIDVNAERILLLLVPDGTRVQVRVLKYSTVQKRFAVTEVAADWHELS